MHKILLIGDSLTSFGFSDENGWCRKLEKLYKNKAILLNHGYPLHTSKMLNPMIPGILSRSSPLLFCNLLLGTNDCFSVNKITDGDYKKYMKNIIHLLHSSNKNIVIFLITPPPTELGNHYILNYVKHLWEIYFENPWINMVIIDLHNGPHKINTCDLEDGVHFNEDGNEKMFQNIKNAIEIRFPKFIS